ncbi:hypothetical protein FQA47_005558 [Oryzias melastigma]|uniref:Uncharacterized protein n=1 Tax=Oryzias melastigma TaxID=30732 RepID=A0A834FAM1_ORYME|nr:hypothetical protein FQA47_005558 [Oryzias melastigma]
MEKCEPGRKFRAVSRSRLMIRRCRHCLRLKARYQAPPPPGLADAAPPPVAPPSPESSPEARDNEATLSDSTGLKASQQALKKWWFLPSNLCKNSYRTVTRGGAAGGGAGGGGGGVPFFYDPMLAEPPTHFTADSVRAARSSCGSSVSLKWTFRFLGTFLKCQQSRSGAGGARGATRRTSTPTLLLRSRRN